MAELFFFSIKTTINTENKTKQIRIYMFIPFFLTSAHFVVVVVNNSTAHILNKSCKTIDFLNLLFPFKVSINLH